VRLGDPVRELAGLGADLLVVGAKRRGPLRRLLFGSTSGGLVRRASCPVLVAMRATPAEPIVPAAGDGIAHAR
jgi:nucleotide-binding universal stress UspA family protein